MSKVAIQSRSYWGALVAWALEHPEDFQAVYVHARNVSEGEDLRERWEAGKPLGDVLVDLYETFPRPDGVSILEESKVHDLEMQAKASGLFDRLQDLRRLLPIILELIELFRKYREISG